MNREIKFRVWDLVEKEFGYYTLPDKETVGITMISNYAARQVYQLFSGLTDRNEKPIYEGDIVSFEEHFAALPIKMGFPYSGIDKYIKKYSEVLFDKGSFILSVSRISTLVGHQNLLSDLTRDIQIEGNIFEDLELISTEKT